MTPSGVGTTDKQAGKPVMTCSACSKTVLESSFSKHLAIHASLPGNVCRHCHGRFNRPDGLKEHLATHHGDFTERPQFRGTTDSNLLGRLNVPVLQSEISADLRRLATLAMDLNNKHGAMAPLNPNWVHSHDQLLDYVIPASIGSGTGKDGLVKLCVEYRTKMLEYESAIAEIAGALRTLLDLSADYIGFHTFVRAGNLYFVDFI